MTGIIAILLYLTALAVFVSRLLKAARAADRRVSEAAKDGVQTIPCLESDHAMASWIWKNLVPRSGESTSVQGELLRALEKLRWEAMNNGNINWDERHESLVEFLYQHLVGQSALVEDAKAGVYRDLDRLRHFVTPDRLAEDRSLDAMLPCVDEDVYERLTAAVVEFGRLNPVIIQRPSHANSTS